MKIEQRQWTQNAKWDEPPRLHDAQLVFVFGERKILNSGEWLRSLKAHYPTSVFFGCSTSGEICHTSIYDDTVSIAAVKFEHTKIKHCSIELGSAEESFAGGQRLAKNFDHKGLKHLLVLSVGLNVNGCELVKGLTSALPSEVAVTGGLAGDKERFEETLVITGLKTSPNSVAAIGLYGDKIKVGYASLGGWDPFGPERLITKSKGNVLYELDGKSALQLYKSYLGKQAAQLPASAQYFPLSLKMNDNDPGTVRTVLGIDEQNQSMLLAGDLPEGGYVRLMKTNFDRLIEGATGAAVNSSSSKPALALLISCVGRRMVLKQRAVAEVESVRRIFGDNTVLTGFYSYGEISPFTPNAKCELHNQTMTITTFNEVDDGKVA